MKILITEATEARILQLTEQSSISLTKDDPGIQVLIDHIETDLAEAERFEGEIYEY